MSLEFSKQHQYLFVIIPSPEVRDQIVAFKQELLHHIGDYSSLHSEPHITLGTISLNQVKEGELLERIRFVCALSKPFVVNLSGFGKFKPHTVYARLANSDDVRKLMSACQNAVQGLPSKKGWQPKAKNPHLTIGRELGTRFNRAKEIFLERSFDASFEVNHLRVMRRELEGHYQVMLEIPFRLN